MAIVAIAVKLRSINQRPHHSLVKGVVNVLSAVLSVLFAVLEP